MSDSSKSKRAALSTPVQFLSGVGPDRARLLEKLGLHTAADVLFFFPRTYQDMSELRSIDRLVEGELASVVGVVDEIDFRGTGPGRSMLGILLRQDNLFLRALWFNQPFMKERFKAGQRVVLSGTPKLKAFRWEMTHPRVQWLTSDEEPAQGEVLPVYPLTDGLNQSQLRRIVHKTVDDHVACLEEVLPESLLARESLLPIAEALPMLHHPGSVTELSAARRRFIYQELLVLQIALAMRKWRFTQGRHAPALPVDPKIHARILRRFPFELTDDQLQAIDDIGDDMSRDIPMNRLLQGDVGSGKTVVAQYAMLLAVAHGYQSALMAPTEILARQHARTLRESLQHSRVRVGLLTGGLKTSQRRKLLAQVADGEIDLLVGTQALSGSDVQFHNLGLVIIDEQHKFGVAQRASLKGAGPDPHYLVMTATPIPRTVSMTVFGDLDISTLRETPAGRQPVHTYLGEADQKEQWWEFFRKKLREGRQGYVITPLVDDADSESLASVERAFEQLANGQLEEFRLGLVHGRMPAGDKDEAMQAFYAGEIQVLVATSVVEVGIDVPNATIMTIESAQRFGLAQLHQLRGRVSRGKHPGYVCVFAEATSAEANQRLRAFAESSDGFRLAELDFELRGPGDLFSTRQHGLPPLRIANVLRDSDVLEETRAVARDLIERDPELRAEEFAKLRRMVLRRYRDVLDLVDVG